MTLDLGRILSRAFAITWRHKWLWLLGVFSGGFAGSSFNYSYSRGETIRGGAASFQAVEAQARAAINQWLGVGLALLGVIIAIAVIAFFFNCVAVPASIWAGVHVDAGEPVTLGDAWREGRRRFGAYLRLALVRLAISVALGIWPLLLFVSAFTRFMNGEDLTAVAGPLIGGALLFFFVLFAGFLVSIALVWSERVLVLQELGALDSIAAGWRLLMRGFGDTIVFGLVMGLVAFGVSLAVGVAAAIVSVPGILLVVATLGAFSGVTIAGIGWIVLFGGAVGLLGGAYVGSLVQVAYALACRDLLLRQGPAAAAPTAWPSAPPA